MMITPNSRARKEGEERGEVKWEYGRFSGEEEGDAGYGGMVQPSQQHVYNGLIGTRGLIILAAF